MIEFLVYPPIRQGSHTNSLVRDVESHLTVQAYNYYRSDTLTTTVHECCHGINADLRNKSDGKVNCFYLMDNRYMSFPEPSWRKRDVIPFIPNELKSSSLYKLYVAGNNWDDRPLYLWDEWTCYVNGSYLGQKYSIDNALVMGFFAGAVIKKEHNFGLSDLFDWLCFQLEPLLTDQDQLYSQLRSYL